MRRGVCQSYLAGSLFEFDMHTHHQGLWLLDLWVILEQQGPQWTSEKLWDWWGVMLGMDFSGGYVVKRWPARRCCLHSRENKALEALAFLQQAILALCRPQQSPVNHCQGVWSPSVSGLNISTTLNITAYVSQRYSALKKRKDVVCTC